MGIIKLMYPLFPRKIAPELETLINTFLKESTALSNHLSKDLVFAISEFLVDINSFYTNAMEGNPSKIKDIEAALNKELLSDRTLRNYQIEHIVHIQVQQELLRRLAGEPTLNICSPEFLAWIHRSFYERLPEEMQVALTLGDKKIPVLPGQFRDRGARVGRHDAPATAAEIERLLADFSAQLNPDGLQGMQKFVGLAASHHRLLWIHPFRDGNGRVARLFTLAYFVKCGVNPHLWSFSRGLARQRQTFDHYLDLADQPRADDLDGRGSLSEKTLEAFCKYFFEISLDQVRYMAGCLELPQFQTLYQRYLRILQAEKKISAGAYAVMCLLIKLGRLPKTDVQRICGVKDRRASQLIKQLVAEKLVYDDVARSALRLRLTSDAAAIVFPGLV